uniref:RNA helicase n=1 Tax=Fundulus heteroclitus TaxID=8078 RepID=A0A3Q2TC61_FUNHE
MAGLQRKPLYLHHNHWSKKAIHLKGKELQAQAGTRSERLHPMSIQALILVTTKEQDQQVQTMMKQLTVYCSTDVPLADISDKADVSTQRPTSMEKPDVVVGAVSDEFVVPKIYQSVLMLATFNNDVQALMEALSSQYYTIKCEEDTFLLIYMLLELQLVQWQTLLFVGVVDLSYILKLFLEEFGIPYHIISHFNHGIYHIIITTDEQSLAEPATSSLEEEKKKKSTENGTKAKVKEYGVSKGVDFQNVANVISFDFPTSVDSYFHQVGRTSRTDNPATAPSFISHTELNVVAEVEDALSNDNAESALKPYEFKMEEIESFRYRCRDAMHAGKKQALLHSESLKTYFEENPRDLQLLQRDKEPHFSVIRPYMKNTPDYLIEHPREGSAGEFPEHRSNCIRTDPLTIFMTKKRKKKLVPELTLEEYLHSVVKLHTCSHL